MPASGISEPKGGIQAASRRPAAIIQPYAAVEVDVAGDFFAAVKVAVVAAVGDLVEIDTRLKRVGNVVPVLPFCLIAVVPAAFLIVRQPGQVGLSAVIGTQVTDLSVKRRAAFADNAGGESGIEVGGKVEIIGDGKGNAVRTGRYGRDEQSAFAVAVKREVRPRRIEKGNAAEHEGGVFGNAYAFSPIGFDRGGLDIPAGISGGTGVELGFRQFVTPFAQHFGGAADALQPPSALFGFHTDVVRFAGLLIEIVGQGFAPNQRTVLLEGEPVAYGNGVARLVVIRPIGIEDCAVPFDDNASFRAHLNLRLSFHPVGNNARIVFGDGCFAAALDGGFGSLGAAAFVTAKQAGRTEGQIESLCGFGRALRTAFCDTPVRLFRRNGIGGAMRAETEAQCQHQWFE